MRLEQPGTPVHDPFFTAVRRRHPEVDLVLLPPEHPPSGAPPVDLSDADALDLRVRLAAQARRLWRASATPPDAGSVRQEPEPDTDLRYGAEQSVVRAVARMAGRRADGAELMVALRATLERAGWRVTHRPGRVEQVTATWAGLDAQATYAAASGVVVLTLSSADQRVGVERARDLVRAGGR